MKTRPRGPGSHQKYSMGNKARIMLRIELTLLSTTKPRGKRENMLISTSSLETVILGSEHKQNIVWFPGHKKKKKKRCQQSS